MPLARIGIGSNVGDAAANVRLAGDRLAGLGTLVVRSSLYRTKAWGVTDQPDFYNAAALLETALSPHDLLRALKDIEGEMGRVTTYRWGPRVIDLDILAYDDLIIDEPHLTVPHPRLRERAFALAPLAEIDAAFVPDYEALDAAARAQAVCVAASDDEAQR
jgi:2-amino-4-hydroxy-6-hydroxymethyldihydropteridine diphosphokinase